MSILFADFYGHLFESVIEETLWHQRAQVSFLLCLNKHGKIYKTALRGYWEMNLAASILRLRKVVFWQWLSVIFFFYNREVWGSQPQSIFLAFSLALLRNVIGRKGGKKRDKHHLTLGIFQVMSIRDLLSYNNQTGQWDWFDYFHLGCGFWGSEKQRFAQVYLISK